MGVHEYTYRYVYRSHPCTGVLAITKELITDSVWATYVYVCVSECVCAYECVCVMLVWRQAFL